MVSDSKKKRFTQGPESEQYDKFKGKRVRVSGLDGHGRTGRLVWVDVYTLGILFPTSTEPSVVYKGPGLTVELSELSAE